VWEALTAIGTIASAIVIAVTVIMAARQVRVTTEQLAQMRRTSQFEAARSVLLEMAEPSFVAAYRFVFQDFKRMLADDAFRADLAHIGIADDSVHKELVVLRAFDRIGTYVRFGLVDGEIIYPTYAARIVVCWEILAEAIAVYRQVAGVPLFENFEHLYQDCRRWQAREHRVSDVAATLGRIAGYRARFPEHSKDDAVSGGVPEEI